MSKCFADGCDIEIAASLLMCYDHWHQVPKSIQQEVNRHWRKGDRRKWTRAAMAAKRSVKYGSARG